MKITLVVMFACIGFFANAQKYGYINSVELLSQMSEVKAADSQLADYQQQLIAKGEQMVKALQDKYQSLSKQAESGTLSGVQIQQKEAELQTDQQDIAKYEQEVQNKILTKREELYKPILDRVKTVLDQIGAENGYTMIFDSSAGVILHASENDDVMPLMKSKLGL